MAQMRSNDAYKGMAHDIFSFTFIQEMLAKSAGLSLGSYIHQVGSFHLYDDDMDRAKRYVDGGIADTIPMPPMPAQPQSGLDWLLRTAASLRDGGKILNARDIDPYWQDLARILQVRMARKARDQAGMIAIRDAMHSDVFRTFILDEIGKA